MDVTSLVDLRMVAAPAYWAAAVAYATNLIPRARRLGVVATAALVVALVAHLVESVGRGAVAGGAGGAPFVGMSGFLSFAAMLLAGSYIAVELRLGNRSLGAFVVAIVAVLHTVGALLFAPPARLPEHLVGPGLVVHVSLMTVGYVAIAVSFASGVTYLMLEDRLRKRKPGVLFQRLPNLDALGRVHRVALGVAVALLSGGVVAGAVWAERVWGSYFRWDQAKQVVTVAALVACLVSLALWHLHAFRGRRAVWVASGAILLMVAGQAAVGHLGAELHRFG